MLIVVAKDAMTAVVMLTAEIEAKLWEVISDEHGIDPKGMYRSYLDLQLECIDACGRRRIDHIFGNCCNISRTNIYATSGEAIQFVGFCASIYSSKLDSLCSSVKPRDDTRTDRTYARWRTSATTGCVDGDVVSYCVSSSPSLSPTPSPSASPAGECDRCASLVGEQWTCLSGKPCFDLQIRLKFLFSVPGSINAHINVFMTQTHYEHPRFSKTSTPSTSRIASMSIGSKT